MRAPRWPSSTPSLPGRASDAGAGIISPETFHEPDRAVVRVRHATRHGICGRSLPDWPTTAPTRGPTPSPNAGRWWWRWPSTKTRGSPRYRPWWRAGAPTSPRFPSTTARAMFPALGRLWRALHSPSAARADGRRLGEAVRVAARAGAAPRSCRWRRPASTAAATASWRCGAPMTSCSCGAARAGGRGVVDGRGADGSALPLPVTPTKGQIVHVVLPDDGRAGSTGAGRQNRHGPVADRATDLELLPGALAGRPRGVRRHVRTRGRLRRQAHRRRRARPVA